MYICCLYYLPSTAYYRLRRTRFLGTQLKAELRAAPVPPLRVPADLVARAHADPLGDGPVLGHLLRERPLRAERLVRRLRGGAAGETTRSRGLSLGTRVCSVRPAMCGVGRSADPRCGRRDATTGGAFWRRSVRRSAAPLVRGARRSQGFLRDHATVRVARGGPRSCSRASLGPRRSLCKQGAEAGPRSLTAAFRCKPACEAIDSVVVMSRRRRMRNETYHGCQIAASLFCARQTKCSKLPVAGVRRRAWAVAGGLQGRLNRGIQKLS